MLKSRFMSAVVLAVGIFTAHAQTGNNQLDLHNEDFEVYTQKKGEDWNRVAVYPVKVDFSSLSKLSLIAHDRNHELFLQVTGQPRPKFSFRGDARLVYVNGHQKRVTRNGALIQGVSLDAFPVITPWWCSIAFYS
ncbi:MAG: hypothetical protein ACI30I_08970 [Parabacteroides sp.]